MAKNPRVGFGLALQRVLSTDLLLFAWRPDVLKRILNGLLIELLVALALVYVGDWAVWRIRLARGGGMGTVSVATVVVTPLKGNKEEYDWGGTMDVDCSRSIFPHGGSGACWWLQIHRTIYER